jgi:hypothetical protein
MWKYLLICIFKTNFDLIRAREKVESLVESERAGGSTQAALNHFKRKEDIRVPTEHVILHR